MGGAGTSEAKEIGEKIRHYRKIKGWSQEVLAGMAGTSASAICNIEKGNRIPGADVLCRIAKELGCGLSDIEPETVYNHAEHGCELEQLIHEIKHIHNGLNIDEQKLMVRQLQAIADTYADRWNG